MKLRAVFAIIGLSFALAACSSKKDEATKDTKATDTTAATDKPPKNVEAPKQPVAPPPAALPAECTTYKELADKLADCTKLGDQAGLLKKQFDTSWTAWAALPASEHQNVKKQCQTAADTLKSAAAASCGW